MKNKLPTKRTRIESREFINNSIVKSLQLFVISTTWSLVVLALWDRISNMKNTKSCPKCSSTDILRITEHTHANFVRGNGIFGSIYLTRFVCADCGYTEQWVDSPADIKQLREKHQPEWIWQVTKQQKPWASKLTAFCLLLWLKRIPSACRLPLLFGFNGLAVTLLD